MAAKLSDLATGFRPEISCPDEMYKLYFSFCLLGVLLWCLDNVCSVGVVYSAFCYGAVIMLSVQWVLFILRFVFLWCRMSAESEGEY
jgi:hypothetical protein